VKVEYLYLANRLLRYLCYFLCLSTHGLFEHRVNWVFFVGSLWQANVVQLPVLALWLLPILVVFDKLGVGGPWLRRIKQGVIPDPVAAPGVVNDLIVGSSF